MPNSLDTDIRFLKGIGEKRAESFKKLGISTVYDLLTYYPVGYENWSDTVEIANAEFDSTVAIKAVVITKPVPVKTHSGKLMYKTCATDGRGIVNLTFFNNRFVVDTLKPDEEYVFYGKIKENEYGAPEMLSPKYEKADTGEYLHPVYRQTALLNSKAIGRAVKNALEIFGSSVKETLPNEQIMKYRLSGLFQALQSIHFPKSEEDIVQARRRLIYEELLILQLGIMYNGNRNAELTSYVIDEDNTGEFIKRLPFELTSAQKRSIAECAEDMKKHTPMKRLLQGDVGSGKTAVAAALMYGVVKKGYQCVLMAPTEVLAKQHFETFRKFFSFTQVETVLLTGSTKAREKKAIKEKIASGQAQIVIGTHAVITKDTVFKCCALAVTDEQHRFGVNQRAALREKGNSPHVLVMSATPIPRTLSLIIYGDLDVSVLDEKPKGRKDVKTYKVPSYYHERIYGFIKKEIQKGHQCYIVCPMVEENEELDIDRKSAEDYYKLLSDSVFSQFRCALLHGKMKQSQKDEVMTRFKNGEIDILVCTVVIEVGIDVPDANVIVIENAECFGLSQLHQLRGRVGRSDTLSYCILVSDAKGEEAQKRFSVLSSTSDGFEIAKQDLLLRGPGDFFGSRQSGLPELKIASLMTDTKIMYAANKEAQMILENDPQLEKKENSELKKRISELFADIS